VDLIFVVVKLMKIIYSVAGVAKGSNCMDHVPGLKNAAVVWTIVESNYSNADM
jgi:hypothetical protein